MEKQKNPPQTLGELRKSSWKSRSVREELRENVKEKLEKGEELFPGVMGYKRTVEVQLVNAILAHHDFILLGLRGQGKTKIIRLLVEFLDEAMPVLAGTALNEDPYSPISPLGRRLIKEGGDGTKIEWLGRADRFKEKLATPDVSIADLIGDIDPIKAAREKLDISNEEVIHWGIIPRSNRGIFAINEVPDLQPRIQVGLFNILEERDIQVRGFPLRVPLDLLLVFSANPEDYTNRGRIITPLKDRIDAQISTHYPKSIEISQKITREEAKVEEKGFLVSARLYEVVERITFAARRNEHIDQMSGVSQRLSISLLESIFANCEQRSLRRGYKRRYQVRLMDVYGGLSAISGKIELLEDRNHEDLLGVAISLIGEGVKELFSELFPRLMDAKGKKAVREREEDDNQMNVIYMPIIDYFREGIQLELNDAMDDGAYEKALGRVPGLRKIVEEHVKNVKEKKDLIFHMELLLEGLYFHSFINREIEDGMITYLDMYSTLLKGLT